MRKCPTCKGRGHNGAAVVAVVTDDFRRCGICGGSGQVENDNVRTYASEVQAVFLLKDGTFFEMTLDRSVAEKVVVVSYENRPNATCLLHHIDSDGVFHYEEAET